MESIWYRREIRSARATAGAATRKARRHAQFAAESYERAAQHRKYAAMLMASGNPEWVARAAEWEHLAASDEYMGYRYIQHSAYQDGQAVFYRDLAARYVQMAADRDARHAEAMAEA